MGLFVPVDSLYLVYIFNVKKFLLPNTSRHRRREVSRFAPMRDRDSGLTLTRDRCPTLSSKGQGCLAPLPSGERLIGM